MPSLTVVTINFNDKVGLQETLQSIKEQDDRDFEYIVVDGGSTDGSLDVIEGYSDIISTLISEKDNGIYDAMNKGLDKATGDYIAFLNSGDVYRPSFVSEYKKNMLDDFDIYHSILAFKSGKNILHYRATSNLQLDLRMIEHPTLVIKSEILRDSGGFSLEWKSASDYELLMRINEKYSPKYKMIEKVLSEFDTAGVSSKSKIGAIESLKIRREFKKISGIKYIVKLCYYKTLSILRQ